MIVLCFETCLFERCPHNMCALYLKGMPKYKTLTTGWSLMKGPPISGWANCPTENPSTWSMEHTIAKLSASPMVSSGENVSLATSKVQNKSKGFTLSTVLQMSLPKPPLGQLPSRLRTSTITVPLWRPQPTPCAMRITWSMSRLQTRMNFLILHHLNLLWLKARPGTLNRSMVRLSH